MINLVIVCSGEIGAQRPLLVQNQTRAATCWSRGIFQVMRADPILLARLPQLLSIIVLANAAHVGCASWGLQHPLRNTDGVLRRSSRNVLHVRLGRHLRKDWLVF